MPIGAVARREEMEKCGGSEARTRWTEIGSSPPTTGPRLCDWPSKSAHLRGDSMSLEPRGAERSQTLPRADRRSAPKGFYIPRTGAGIRAISSGNGGPVSVRRARILVRFLEQLVMPFQGPTTHERNARRPGRIPGG